MKKTKIVCTLGPATTEVDTIVRLIESGMNVARLNFSHGDHHEQALRINNLKQARQATGQNVGLMLDTKGPEIRTHAVKDNGVVLDQGQSIRIYMKEILGDQTAFSVTYSELIHDVHVGGHILLDDGLIDLLITSVSQEAGYIEATVQNGGILRSHKGVNVPNVSLKLPTLTERDLADIQFGVTHAIDFIAASFVRSAKDVLEIRQVLEDLDAGYVNIIAKIENQEGVDNLDEILSVTDGVMVARGDLGVEIPTAEVLLVQKEIIKKCNQLGKPVITATQMLDSMQWNPRPTRAEASDVANAIFDGSDAVMLSGETAAGSYPIEALQMMTNICLRTEEAMMGREGQILKSYDNQDLTEAIGQAVGHTVKNVGIKTIVAATSSGHTARMIAKYRPNANIIAATFDSAVTRRMTLVWGVQAHEIEQPYSTDDMLNMATRLVEEEGYAKAGDLIVITAGVPIGEAGTTNMMKIQAIGSLLTQGDGIGNGTHIGKAVLAYTADEAKQKMIQGAVLVAPHTDTSYLPALRKAGALIVEEGGITSHTAVMGLELGIPVIVGCQDALTTIQDNELLTVDARRGRVYHGATLSL